MLATAADLEAAGVPLKPFEFFRPPERQAELYARGRALVPPFVGMSIVTYAQAWHGAHCFGLAGDFQAKVEGKWSFESNTEWTAALREIGAKYGLLPIMNRAGKIIDPPHLQYEKWNQGDCLAGRYPDGGDASWAENLDETVLRWGYVARRVHGIKHPGSPPVASRESA
jgi:peptidoglycan L-alanyl-D-glutamate endopeptidase CwlK